ncbi:tetratricopeptide repeat protein [Mongoliitalea daihaiensis]|uniref:tetratricopeptide repeat protein n=1 Tax=Mongoliitalea daihaiensis TaxID=2782006 RepID=UPI00293E02C2|nr:tetratricopeptide repeat protein [Mongoliitalea daihaiensis]
MKILQISIFLIICLTAPSMLSAQKLSRKEKKQELEQLKANRLFIDGQRYMMLEDFDRAYFYFKKTLELTPHEAAPNFKVAEILLRANQVDEALAYGMKAVDADPSNKYYRLVMAEVFTKQGQPGKAAEILEDLMANTTENQNYILDLASLYLSAGDFDNALSALDRAEDYYGVIDQLIFQKQRIYLRRNNLKAAVEEGKKLINSSPGNAQNVISLVEILFNNGRSQEAIDLIEDNLKAYPNQAELQMAAYALYRERGDVATAEDFIKTAFSNPDLDPAIKAKAFAEILQEMKTERRERLLDTLEKSMLELNSNDADVNTVVGDRAFFAGNKEQALALYRTSLQINPANAQVLQGVITNLFESTQDFETIETYTIIAVDEFPERPEFWFFDGTAKLAQKKGEAAVESLEKAIEINRGRNKQLDLLAMASLGDALHQAGKKEEAFKMYDKVLTEKPDDEHVLNNYAYFLSLSKQNLEKAKKMSEGLVKRFPKNATYLDTHAWVLFQLKEYEDARSFMERALASEENPSGIMFEHYGDILYHLGKRNEAMTYWKKAEGGDDISEFLNKKIRDQKYYD